MTRDEVTAAFEKITGVPDFGFSCDDGWMPLLGIVAREITAIPAEDRTGFRVDQVKEKWGTLRFYYGFSKRRELAEISIIGARGVTSTRLGRAKRGPTEAIATIVHAAELASHFICEKCGKPGRVGRAHYYVEALCDEHAMEAKQLERESGEIRIGVAPDGTIPMMLHFLSELWMRDITMKTLEDELGTTVIHEVDGK